MQIQGDDRFAGVGEGSTNRPANSTAAAGDEHDGAPIVIADGTSRARDRHRPFLGESTAGFRQDLLNCAQLDRLYEMIIEAGLQGAAAIVLLPPAGQGHEGGV